MVVLDGVILVTVDVSHPLYSSDGLQDTLDGGREDPSGNLG